MSTKSLQTPVSPSDNSYGPLMPGGRQNQELNPLTDLQTYAKKYVEQQPEMAALFCLGIGFVLGWKLKPW